MLVGSRTKWVSRQKAVDGGSEISTIAGLIGITAGIRKALLTDVAQCVYGKEWKASSDSLRHTSTPAHRNVLATGESYKSLLHLYDCIHLKTHRFCYS